jgi:transglutaminase-like putative cysteine protease
MRFFVTSSLYYYASGPSTLLCSISCARTPGQKITKESITTSRELIRSDLRIWHERNRFTKFEIEESGDLAVHYLATARATVGTITIEEADCEKPHDLDAKVIPYLFPSRYCQSDQLHQIAFDLFGQIIHPLAKAAAISDWLFENLCYAPGSSDASTSACDTLNQRTGVCRDFAHLGIAFCRALSIPARYFTGYACNMQPPDFHACFEVCVGNQWFIFDPTRLSSPNGLIRIATGRDAADASLATIFGAVEMKSIAVSCTADYFQPMSHDELIGKAVLLEP